IRDVAIGGDAPKDVIQVYQYNGIIRKQSPKTWPVYIAKIGRNWYPNESITEQLITEIGKEIGVKIAESELFFIEGVIRFVVSTFAHTNKYYRMEQKSYRLLKRNLTING